MHFSRFFAFVLFFFHALLPAAETRVVDLRCEYAVDPLGIDLEAPRLFWRLESEERGARQTASQVLVASSEEKLARDEGDLWNSGRVDGSETTQIAYEGRALQSSQQVFWKVRSWEAQGAATDWSAVATWTMGQLEESDWTGSWIASPEYHESELFRSEFEIGSGLKRALLHVSGLGQYELFLNGRKSGRALMAPGWTDFEESTLYNSRDVTELLKEGRNAIGVVLANGMYHVVRGERFSKFQGSFGRKRLILELRLEYEDGRVESIATDGSWQTRAGPVVYASMYGGETFDAREEPKGWKQPGFDASDWAAAEVLDLPRSTLRGHRASVEPIAPIERRKPVREIPLGVPGGVTYDLGQNASYMPRIRVSGPAGSRVVIVPGELIYPDGYVTRSSMGGIHRGSSWWEYIKATDEPEAWFPQFYYIGSRYLQTQGFAPEGGGPLPEIESIEGTVVHATVEPVGKFEASDPMLNEIRDLVRWAQRSNMVSVLTDSPHREKLGWLEQYHLNGPAIRYEFDMARMFTKGMQDMADAQTPEGLVPNIAPEFTEFRGSFRAAAEWGAAFIVVPWQQYQFLGDTALLRRHYAAMKRYYEYLESRTDNDILRDGLGDWHDYGPRRLSRAELTPSPVTASAFYFQNARILAEVAQILGETADAEGFAADAERIRERYNEAFFDPEKGAYSTDSQTAQALPLVMGIVEDEDRAGVLRVLMEDLESRNYGMTSGDVGFRYLIQALARNDQNEAIYRMISRREAPGYGYMLEQGATTLTESWEATPSSSQNHFMLGHITEWFYADLLGIAPAPDGPGFKKIIIRPNPVDGLDWVEGSYETLHGRVALRWERDRKHFRIETTIPPNTTATVHMPVEGAHGELRVDGVPVDEVEDVKFLREEAGRRIYAVESGSYEFVQSR